jgi:hypothetical protein
MSKLCEVCGTEFTKRRPNSCQRCYFKKRHEERYQNKLRKCKSCDNEFYLGHKTFCETCKDNILKCDPHHRIYFGRKFYKAINGYWVCSRKLLPWAHRWVWINEKGEIPNGYDIHHIDGNKDNNSIENLEKITRSEHQQRHWDQGDHDHEMELRIQNLAKYRKKRN